VRRWLEAMPLSDVGDDELASRTSALVELGFKGFDALHVASAELARADVLVTRDQRFLAAARQSSEQVRVRASDPLGAAREVFA
jgi:predicted nucleic acid-binding protein